MFTTHTHTTTCVYVGAYVCVLQCVCVFCTMKTQVVFTLNLHNSRTFPFWADESFAAACKIHADFQSSTREIVMLSKLG